MNFIELFFWDWLGINFLLTVTFISQFVETNSWGAHTHFVVGTHFLLQNEVRNPTWSIERGQNQISRVLKTAATELDFIKAWGVFWTCKIIREHKHKSREYLRFPKDFIKKSMKSNDLKLVDSIEGIFREMVFRNPAAGRDPSIGQPSFHLCCWEEQKLLCSQVCLFDRLRQGLQPCSMPDGIQSRLRNKWGQNQISLKSRTR